MNTCEHLHVCVCECMLRKVWFGKGSDGASHGKSYRKSIPGRGKGNADAESMGRAGVSVADSWEESSGQDWGEGQGQGSFGLWKPVEGFRCQQAFDLSTTMVVSH